MNQARNSFAVFFAVVFLNVALRAAQTNVTVLLTNQCQVTGILVGQDSSKVVVSVGVGQPMTFSPGEILSLKMTEVPDVKPPETETRITLSLTNGYLISGFLVSQSASDFVVSVTGGQRLIIARGKVSSFKLTTNSLVAPPAAVATASGVPSFTAPTGSIASEFNKPHTEDEMRAMLRTPEGAALVKTICDMVIGPGTDPQTSAATASYLKTMEDFKNGKIGIAEIQASARSMLGTMSEHQDQINNGPQAGRWNEYEEVLQGFVSQPAPTPVAPVQ